MTRKDSEKDADRPHYYSQFWLDIAAGRRVIGGPKPEDAEASEAEIPEPTPLRKATRGTADTLKETRVSAVAEPEIEDEEELEQDDTVEESDLPNIVFDDDAEVVAAEVTEEDSSEEEAESEDEEELLDEEEEEEDEEGEWGRRGGARKKPKPVRPVKPVKKPKREIRRNF